MSQPSATTVTVARREAIECADLIVELGHDDLIALFARLAPYERRLVYTHARRIADDRRARPGSVCGMCGDITHITSQCALSLFAAPRGQL